MKLLSKIKKYLKHPKNFLLFFIDRGFFNKMSDEKYLKMNFKIRMNRELDLKNPKSFNEKIQWLKLYDRKEKYTKMVDKYEAKEYVKNILGEEYIIPTLGVWEKFDDIDFDKLPNQFVLKCTHDSGGLVICKDKSKLNKEEARKKINKSLKNKFFYNFREWPYKNVKPRIIAEKFMDIGSEKGLVDYKFFCFNGEPKLIYVSEGLEDHSTASIEFLDMNYERLEFKRNDFKTFDVLPKKPVNFEKMKEVSKILSKDNAFLRVDLYEINNNIYFSELTFSPCGGFLPFEPVEWDFKLGEWINLPIENKKD